ncbi:MAG: response regulator [Desulfovibrio sp.]|nr:MAG: response regulator [Desulfovibrio sp.]
MVYLCLESGVHIHQDFQPARSELARARRQDLMNSTHPGLAPLTALLDKGAMHGARLLGAALERELTAGVSSLARLDPDRYTAYLAARGARPLAAVRLEFTGDLEGAAVFGLPADKTPMLTGGEPPRDPRKGPGPASLWPYLEAGSAVLNQVLEHVRKGLGLHLDYGSQEYRHETAESLMTYTGSEAGEPLTASIRFVSGPDAATADLLLLLSRQSFQHLLNAASRAPVSEDAPTLAPVPAPDPKRFGMFHSLPLGAMVVAPDHKVLFWNRTMAELTGLDSETMVGTDIRSRFPALAREQVAGRLASVFAGGPKELFSAGLHRSLFPLPDRRQKLVQLTASALEGPEGARPALVLAQDVTSVQEGAERQARVQRAALGEAERLALHNKNLASAWTSLAAVLDSAPGIVYAVRPDFGLVEANELLLSRHSLQGRDAIQGRKCHDLFRGRHSPCPDCPAMAALRHGVAGSRPAMPEEEDHFGRDAKVLAQPQKDANGAVLGATIMAVDVGDLKALERKQALARQAAESSSRMKNAFLAAMTKEVRTSLTGLTGAAEMALTLDPAPAQKESLLMIKNAAGRTLSILQDVHDLARIESGGLTLARETFALREVMDRALASAAYECTAKDVELKLSIDPGVPERIAGDPGRLGRVLAHLVGNAARFTNHGEIIVEAALTRPSGEASDAVLISVSDTGQGIEPEYLDRLRAHFRHDGIPLFSGENYPGLGLTICRSFVDRMGGRIWVESEPGEGAVFFLTIPTTPAEDSEPVVEPPSVPTPGVAILATEDDPLYAKFLVHSLAREGHRVHTVSHGQQALSALKEGQYSVALLDARSPGMEDGEVIRAIRGKHPALAVIVHAVGPAPGEREEALAAGADDFLNKPVSLRRLLSAMAMAMAKRENLSKADSEETNDRGDLLDTITLGRVYAGEPETARELLDIYLEEGPDLFQRLSRALDNSDLDKAVSLAHSLANAARTIRAKSLENVCVRLEETAKIGHRASTLALAGDLERELERTDQAVMAYLETL